MIPLAHLPDQARLQASTLRVEDLIRDVRAGRLTTPVFQRGLKWNDDDRIAFFDSLVRGYPVGNLLVQRRPKRPGESIRLGKLKIEPSADNVIGDIIDGQQRVHTIASEALRERLDAQRPVYFDLVSHELGAVPRGRKEPPRHWLLLSTALDSNKLIEWLVEAQLPREQREEAIGLGKRLREYDLPVYYLEDAASSVAREIFRRTNRTGHRLEEAEVFDSLFTRTGRGGRDSIAGIVRRIESDGFGQVPEETVRQTLLAILGKDPLRATADDVERDDVKAGLPRTREALLRSVELVQEAGFLHARLLPYSLTLVMLGAFFDRFSETEVRTRILLRRWIWRGGLNAMHRGDVAPIRRALKVIRTHSEGAAASELARQMMATEALFGGGCVRVPLRTNHAQGRIAIAAALALGPLGLDGEKVDAMSIFGSSPLVGVGLTEAPSPLRGTLADRLLLPTDTVLDAEDLVGMSEEWLARHALDRTTVQWLAAGELSAAVERRATALEARVDAILRARAEWTQNDRVAIKALLQPGESAE
ncbi:MAG: DUF262 domain-containing protein [Sandaracinus sp.]